MARRRKRIDKGDGINLTKDRASFRPEQVLQTESCFRTYVYQLIVNAHLELVARRHLLVARQAAIR